MRTISTTLYVSLDGVTQAPARPDEDTRGGFDAGGWASALMDDVIARESGQGMAAGPELVFGRRTYQDFAEVWPGLPDSPFTPFLTRSTKYVCSRTGGADLAWENSRSLTGEAARTLAELKATDGPDLMILGSVDLVRSLQGTGLIDVYTLMICPIVLGAGHRLFDRGAPMDLELTGSVVSGTGVTLNTYRTGRSGRTAA